MGVEVEGGDVACSKWIICETDGHVKKQGDCLLIRKLGQVKPSRQSSMGIVAKTDADDLAEVLEHGGGGYSTLVAPNFISVCPDVFHHEKLSLLCRVAER